MILQNLVDCKEDRRNFLLYATVSVEFRSFLEPICFHTITFSNARRMFQMDSIITPRRRRYVRTVALEYEIRLRRTEIVSVQRHDISFSVAVWQLFRELSTWEPTSQGLKLELSACQGTLDGGSSTYGCRCSHEIRDDSDGEIEP